MEMIKKWWFYFLIPIILICIVMSIDTSDPQPYKDYIFYGISQNKVTNNKLKVIYSTRGFPANKHDVYTEIMTDTGKLLYLPNETHTGNHKGHYSKDHKALKRYDKTFHLDLRPGKYKIRLRFEFKYGISGHLSPIPYHSNWVSFEVV